MKSRKQSARGSRDLLPPNAPANEGGHKRELYTPSELIDVLGDAIKLVAFSAMEYDQACEGFRDPENEAALDPKEQQRLGARHARDALAHLKLIEEELALRAGREGCL